MEDSIYCKTPMCISSFCASCKFFIFFSQLISLKPCLFIYMSFAYAKVFITIALNEPKSEWKNVCTNPNIIDVMNMFQCFNEGGSVAVVQCDCALL